MTHLAPLLVLAPLALAACAAHNTNSVLPPLEGPSPAAELTLVWVGFGECERLEDGVWVRRPAFDYEFTVVQRRYADHWHSIKYLNRRHPDYDGSAGARDQTLYFQLGMGPVGSDGVPIRLQTGLGPGDGKTDAEFRQASFELHPEISSLAPFDTYRIDQTHAYEAGTLTETVRLDKGTQPWVRNHEVARLYAAQAFETAPTRR